MKKYVKDALNVLIQSTDLKTHVTLKKGTDFKKNPIRLLYNKLILTLQKKIIPSHFKNWLLRTTGMNVEHDVCVPHDITFDYHFPELIHLKKGCLVGGGCNFITHQFKNQKLVLGKVVISERVLIGGLCDLEPGAFIPKHSMLNLHTKLDKKMPAGVLYGGKPAKILKKFSKDDIKKYFGESNKDKLYYKKFKKQVKEFVKSKDKSYLKIFYNGKRLNAGDDWFYARNVFRIYINGVIIEFTRLLPHCFLKTLLLRMLGVKIGKNVRIGKGVVFDHIYCDSIIVEDNVTIDDYVYLDGHEYTITQTIFGKTLLKKGVHIKEHSFVRTGTTIGEGSVIEKHSMAQRVIPPHEVWEGIPAQKVRGKK